MEIDDTAIYSIFVAQHGDYFFLNQHTKALQRICCNKNNKLENMAFDSKTPSTSNLTSESSQYWDDYFQYLE